MGTFNATIFFFLFFVVSMFRKWSNFPNEIDRVRPKCAHEIISIPHSVRFSFTFFPIWMICNHFVRLLVTRVNLNCCCCCGCRCMLFEFQQIEILRHAAIDVPARQTNHFQWSFMRPRHTFANDVKSLTNPIESNRISCIKIYFDM